MATVAVPESVWNEVVEHFRGVADERFGFLLAGEVTTPRGPRFVVDQFLPIADDDVDLSYESERNIRLQALLDIVNRARREGMALIEIHNHALTTRDVEFSPIDWEGLDEFSEYVMDALPGRAYGALVLGSESVDGVYFLEPRKPLPIHRVAVVGASYEATRTTSAPRNHQPAVEDRQDRQVQMFGENGQHLLNDTTVAIAGVGGLGCHLVQQLAYLGVRRFVLIDPDLVEATNLNRLIGATKSDVGRPKVEVLADLVYRIAGKDAHVECLQADVQDQKALHAITSADILLGGFDNDGARLVLDQWSRALVLPFFDLASGIEAPDGAFEQAGGRLAFLQPDGPCLSCLDEIDPREARYFLSSETDKVRDRTQGYVDDWEVPAPSVVSLNGVIASMAVNEFLLYITGLGNPKMNLYFYMREPSRAWQATTRRKADRKPGCFTCSLRGRPHEVSFWRP